LAIGDCQWPVAKEAQSEIRNPQSATGNHQSQVDMPAHKANNLWAAFK
jgi:hypothetical protein